MICHVLYHNWHDTYQNRNVLASIIEMQSDIWPWLLQCLCMWHHGPGDIGCRGNAHISSFEYFARGLYVCLWTYFCQPANVTTVQDTVTKMKRCVVEFDGGRGPSKGPGGRLMCPNFTPQAHICGLLETSVISSKWFWELLFDCQHQTVRDVVMKLYNYAVQIK